MESKKKLSKLPSSVMVVGGFTLLVAIVAAAFYLFQHRVANDKNTLTDGKPGNFGENMRPATSSLDKTEVIEWYETSIGILEKRLDRLEKKALEAGEDMQEVYRNSMATTQSELKVLRLELKKVKEATEDNWEALKAKIEKTKARVNERLKNDSLDYPA